MATNNTDQTQFYTAECGVHSFTLPLRYQELAPIGTGAFGAVIRAKDTVTGKTVAIKKMLRPFDTTTHAKRAYRELRLLMHLNHPDAQVVQLYNVFTPEQNINNFRTLYFVFNDGGQNLDRVIRRNVTLTEDHIKLIVYSLLRGLKFIHSAGVIHRDLKPANVGIDKNSDVTILDFGLARVQSTGFQTGYVATRWWRAPEVYVSWERYNDKLDVWSIGCIMAELISLRSIFRGSDHIDQLKKIFDIIGTPDSASLNEICSPEAQTFISQMTPRPRQDFNALFGFKYDPETPNGPPISGVSPDGVDLLAHLLLFDYRQRLTTQQALEHPFFEEFHDPMDEPTIEPMTDVHQDAEYSIEKWKLIIWGLIQDFLPPSWVNDIPENN